MLKTTPCKLKSADHLNQTGLQHYQTKLDRFKFEIKTYK